MAREVWATCLGCWPWMDGWLVYFALLCFTEFCSLFAVFYFIFSILSSIIVNLTTFLLFSTLPFFYVFYFLCLNCVFSFFKIFVL